MRRRDHSAETEPVSRFSADKCQPLCHRSRTLASVHRLPAPSSSSVYGRRRYYSARVKTRTRARTGATTMDSIQLQKGVVSVCSPAEPCLYFLRTSAKDESARHRSKAGSAETAEPTGTISPLFFQSPVRSLRLSQVTKRSTASLSVESTTVRDRRHQAGPLFTMTVCVCVYVCVCVCACVSGWGMMGISTAH